MDQLENMLSELVLSGLFGDGPHLEFAGALLFLLASLGGILILKGRLNSV